MAERDRMKRALESWRDYSGDNLDAEFKDICEAALITDKKEPKP